MRPNQSKFFKRFLKILVIILLGLFTYFHPIAMLIIVLSIIGVGVLLVLFLTKLINWWNENDFMNFRK